MHLRTYATREKSSVGRLDFSLKNYLFGTLVLLVILYGVEVWGGSLSKSTWKEFESIQKCFLTNFLQVKVQTPYPLLLLECGILPIEVLGMERATEDLIKIWHNPPERLPNIASSRPKKHTRARY